MNTKPRKVLLLVNSSAGLGAASAKLFDIVKYLTLYGCEVTVYPVLRKEGINSEQVLRERGQDFDVITCYGGDGTLNRVISGMLDAGLDRPLGFFPGGSTNDFAKSVGLGTDLSVQCRAVAGTNAFAHDIGRFNDQYFNYVAAFGAFTQVSYHTNQSVKNALGYWAYVLETIHSLPESVSSRCRMRIEHDGVVEEGFYLYGAISNSRSVGGLSTALMKNAVLDDGKFEVMLVTAPDNIVEVGEIMSCLASGSTDHRNVKLFTASKLRIISPDKAAWTLDGEFGGNPENIDITVLPKAIRILVPQNLENR